jgi:hypothetical protein
LVTAYEAGRHGVNAAGMWWRDWVAGVWHRVDVACGGRLTMRVEIPMKQDGKNAPKVRKGEDMAQTSGVFPQLTKGGKKKGGRRGC